MISYSNVHLWQLKSVFNVASLHVQVNDNANDQIIRLKVLKILKSINITQASVQVDYCYIYLVLCRISILPHFFKLF